MYVCMYVLCGFQVWVAREDFREKLEGIQAPLSDLENILKEILFSDETTRSRGRGWMVLPSRRYLRADILFPGASFIADSPFVYKQVSTSTQVYKF